MTAARRDVPLRRGCRGALSHGPPSGLPAASAGGPRLVAHGLAFLARCWGELCGEAGSGARPQSCPVACGSVSVSKGFQGSRFPAAVRRWCLVLLEAVLEM